MEYRNKSGQHKIAIVGTGSLFPGALDSKDFWLNILAERDFIRDVPETHWLKEDYYDPSDRTGDKVYCKKGAFLDDVCFDPVEFGMPPNLLSTTDTVQLLSLIVARDALADTLSYQQGKVDKKKVSVILGVAGGTELIGQMSARIHKPEWVMAMRKQGLPESKIQDIVADLDTCYTKWTENTFPGLLGNVVSGRIANRFDLKGTNCVLDAACASSLAAVKMAVQELQLGTTDMVISGGADALNDIFMYMCFSKTTALSPTEDCRPFSEEGDGTVLGEAVVMLALKRLEDAERDGDRVYAVISSIGSSSDGKSGSIYAPDSNGQSIAIKRAHEAAGVTPDEITLVEGHGTGTLAGDYSEFNGLKLAYGETAQKQYCALGSVKSMIGHTKSAAGAASLLKVAMALNNAVLPPTLKVRRPSSKLNIEDSPFYLNTVARPWIHHLGAPRMAGVSSMGFGGTNFHVVMEAYDKKEQSPNKIYRQGRELVLISGKSKAEIIDGLNKLRDVEQELVQLAKATQGAFKHSDNCRLGILGENIAEVIKWIEYAKSELTKGAASIEVNNSVFYAEGRATGSVAFLFAGQGSQYVNMGVDLLMQYDEALNAWDKVSSLNLDPANRLENVVYPIPVFSEEDSVAQANLLTDTKWAQPAIGVLALSHLNLLKKLDVAPAVVGGHSYGEIAALYAAGVISNEEDLVRISRKRGELMASASEDKGAMTAVFASESAVAQILKKAKTKVVVANVNSPGQTVVSGSATDIEKIEKEIAKAGLRFQRLNVSTAFHSELVSGSAAEFEAFLGKITLAKPSVPVYANTTASHYQEDVSKYGRLIANQLAAPVQFEKQVRAMYDEGARVFIEVGPGRTLSNFVKDILQDHPHKAISIDGGRKQNSKDAFWVAVGQLAVAGVSLSLGNMWMGIDENKKVVAAKKSSAATVKINGANYGKPYPPVGGFKSLPKPNPEPARVQQEKAHTEPVASKEAQQATISVQPQHSVVQDNAVSKQNQSQKYTQTQSSSSMSGVNNQWLHAFQEIQKNALEAQKHFQETLAQSHKLFLETSQIAFQQLSGLSGQGTGEMNSVRVADTPQPRQMAEAFVSVLQPIVQMEKAAQPAVVIPAQAPPVQAQPAVTPPAAKPIEVRQSTAESINVEDAILTVVSEKTGYPKEILDLTTDLESGFGIDSIKRVEILSALQEMFPELKNVDRAKLAAMNTLGEIVSFSNGGSASLVAAGSSSAANADIATDNNSIQGDFEDVMLNVVAEKTGYPKEIIDMDTDLESGLGIDSIKRVEILSVLQEKFPVLKSADRAKLAAMKTLGEIMDFAIESGSINGNASGDTKKKVHAVS